PAAASAWRGSAGRSASPAADRSPRASSAAASVPPPHVVGDRDDHAQLRPLLVLGQDVALLGRSEAALRRHAKLVDVDVPRRFLDAKLDVVLALERAGFRRDEAEHDLLLALRQEAQRLEVPGARGVVFEEIAVVVDAAEQQLGDRLVAAFGLPAR